MMANDFAPRPAKTWEEATDENGVITDDTLPRRLVHDEATFRRWRFSLQGAVKIAREPEEATATRKLAFVIFDSPYPTEPEGERMPLPE